MNKEIILKTIIVIGTLLLVCGSFLFFGRDPSNLITDLIIITTGFLTLFILETYFRIQHNIDHIKNATISNNKNLDALSKELQKTTNTIHSELRNSHLLDEKIIQLLELRLESKASKKKRSK